MNGPPAASTAQSRDPADLHAEQLERERRERAHYDQLWGTREDLQLPAHLPHDPWTTCRLQLLRPLAGRHVLDLGCGKGVWSVLLALENARVAALDISAEGARFTSRRAEFYGVGDRVVATTGSAHALPYPDNAFDLIHGENILHHLDVDRAGRELARVLKPGGRAVFLENSANNKLLMLARKLCGHFGIHKSSTDDEYPLRRRQIRVLVRRLGPCRVHYPLFCCFHMLDEKMFPGRRVTAPLDTFVYRWLPLLRRYSYNQILEFRCLKPAP